MSKQNGTIWSDEKLILHYYGELNEAESKACLQAMEKSDALRQHYAGLCNFLAESLEIDVPEPSGQLNQNIMAAVYQQESRNQKDIKPEENKATVTQTSDWLAWLPKINIAAGSVAALLMVISVFYIGRWSAEVDTPKLAEQPKESTGNFAFTELASQKVLYNNLSRHL
ncbi:MAG: hypothetical protein OQK04_16140, partial [Kangiellaceae bacterium]|nr:hypothetical protein [Kangiellaceae bacterium]